MTFTQERQKKILAALTAVFALLLVYRILTAEKPKTSPLTYQRGAVASSPVRQGVSSRAGGADPLNMFLERRGGKFPGVTRDIFRMENPPKPKTVTPPPPVHVKTPEELAAEAAQAAANAAHAAAQAAADSARIDLSKFSFLGYLTDKDDTLFLSKDGELFIVKSGGLVLRNYKVKEAGKDSVVLLDTVTRVEVRIYLSGGGPPAQLPQSQQPLQKSPQQLQQQPQPPPQPSPKPEQQRPPIYRKPPASG
jgi:hypothetical protein